MGADKQRRAEQARPAGYRQNAVRQAPGGERPAQGNEPKRLSLIHI